MLANSFKHNDSLDCPICFNKTNGLKMTYHDYMKYQILWDNKTPVDCPLVKCIKCVEYTCSDCMQKIKGCPFNCHEVGQPKTETNSSRIYRQYAINKDLGYHSQSDSGLWLAQAIYEYQNDPRPELRVNITQNDIQQAKQQTIDLFDQIAVNIDEQRIQGYIQLPFNNERILLNSPLRLVLSNDNYDVYRQEHGDQFKILDASQLYKSIKEQFKSDLLGFFDTLNTPQPDLISHVMYFKQFINIEYQPNCSQTVFDLGYTDYIRKVSQQWLYPIRIIVSFDHLDIPYTYVEFLLGLSLDHGLTPFYKLQQISNKEVDDLDIDKNDCIPTLYYATPEQFKEFFKDCK